MKILKKLMTMIGIVSVLAVSMMLTACPPATGTQQPGTNGNEIVSESEANSAASGISASLTVTGKIDDTTCDIKLDATIASFEATQSRSDVTFKGTFFYYLNTLSMKVEYKNNEDFVKYYFATTELTDGATITLEEKTENDYKLAQTGFAAVAKTSFEKLLKKIDDALANTKVEFTKTTDGLSVKAFNETFTVKINGLEVEVNNDTPSWFKTVWNYISTSMDAMTSMITSGTTQDETFMPSKDSIKTYLKNILFKQYTNIANAVCDLFDAYFDSVIGDNSGDALDETVKAIIDRADEELTKYVNYTIDASLKRIEIVDKDNNQAIIMAPVFTFTFYKSAETTDDAETCTLILAEEADVDSPSFSWLTDLVSLFVAKDLDEPIVTETTDTGDVTSAITAQPKANAAVMMYISTKEKVAEFLKTWMKISAKLSGNPSGNLDDYKNLFDAAETELSKYLPNGIKVTLRTADSGFVPFIILGEETDSNYQEFSYSSIIEPVPPEWFTNLMEAIGGMITPDMTSDSPVFVYIQNDYPGVTKMLSEIIALMNSSNPMSGLLDELFGDVTADLAKGEAYLNGKTFDVTIDTTATAGPVIKISINGTSATDKSEWTITPEGTGVISDSAPGWFKAVFPVVVGIANKNGDFYNDLQTVMAALSTDYRNVAQLMYNIFAVTYQMSNGGDNPLAEYADELAAAEAVLGNYANSNMTAVMTSDGLQITIGGEGTNKIEFLYIPTETTQSSDVPEWFVNLYPVISTLMDGTSGDNTAAAAMNYLMQNYPGMAKLTQAIAATMQGIMENAIKVYYDNNVIYSFQNMNDAQTQLKTIGLSENDYTIDADGKSITLTNSQAYENFMNAMNGSNNPTVLGAVISYTKNDSTVNWTDISFDTKEAAESALAELGLSIEAGDYTQSQKTDDDNNGIVICFILTDSGYEKYLVATNNNGGQSNLIVKIYYTSTNFQPREYDNTADAYNQLSEWELEENTDYTISQQNEGSSLIISFVLTDEGYQKYLVATSNNSNVSVAIIYPEASDFQPQTFDNTADAYTLMAEWGISYDETTDAIIDSTTDAAGIVAVTIALTENGYKKYLISSFITEKAQDLATAQAELVGFIGDMTADLTDDSTLNASKINVTIGDDIAFYIAIQSSEDYSISNNAPQWFEGIFQQIYYLAEKQNVPYIDIAGALENKQYNAVAELVGKIGTEINGLH